jgi:UDP-N-acetylglucosamine 2-epimerase (non-hydrolysing)
MLLIAYGTRPEWLKIKPLIIELKKTNIRFCVLFTGQHENIIDSNIFDENDINFQISLGNTSPSNRLNNILSGILSEAEVVLRGVMSQIKYVLVQGDTTSALAVALFAYNRGLKVIHLEAGLRTHDLDNPYPEEANRQLISRITTVHLCPTIQNEGNLNNEQVGGSKYVVGNTALDNLLHYVSKCDYENKILITLHRRENHETIQYWFEAIDKLAGIYKDHEFILPIHPNPNVKKFAHILKNVKVVEPLSHEDLLNILVKCKFVITDSGGIQEECSFFGKRAIVCRKETERPEALGYTTELCEKPKELITMTKELMKKYEVTHNHICPFGDGHSAKKITKIIKELYENI